jgi:hypothetical protein
MQRYVILIAIALLALGCGKSNAVSPICQIPNHSAHHPLYSKTGTRMSI